MAFNKLTLEQKLLTKASPQGDCLVWVGQKCPKGYGRIKLNGRLERAHRVMYELHYGAIPDGAVIMHSCDNPACINIAHLSAGTQADNMRDMHGKGRAKYLTGEDNHKSKLTVVQVEEIRRRYKSKHRKDGSSAMAREFGVHRKTIAAIISGKNWSES